MIKKCFFFCRWSQIFPPVFDIENLLHQLSELQANSGEDNLSSLSPNRKKNPKNLSKSVCDPWLVEAEAHLLILSRQVK